MHIRSLSILLGVKVRWRHRPGQLRPLFDGFAIVRYEEVDDVGDWGGPGSRLVRMIASKR